MKSTKEETMSSPRSTIIKKIGEWQLPADSRVFGHQKIRLKRLLVWEKCGRANTK